MTERLAGEEQEVKERIQITYYFTVIFIAIGMALIFFILYQKIEKINLFIILLSASAGGIPVGFIGAYIDYKVSVLRFKNRGLGQ
ncbi:hypothetical protein JSQ81_03865 [Sporosarcina sp. Marseille-Q4063]|uniref:hypothetical protein n=1 Tax=Sporosarcina sp. Marseille-Q4063 TaxID=2810514 RepID=UPI001BAF63F4|nr:hypothetical protein [Sporosarcina sp. Marseille-Q4063]QUW22729.1 hypothetical protein JSQ81_03865 [Sporosarcina sp. Marseille-Q4063]